MSRSAADLPEDTAEMRRFAAALATEVHAKTLLIEKLRMQLSILRRAFRAVVGEARPRDRATGAVARRHRGERRRATGANRSFRRRGFFLPAVEEVIRPQASARSSAARDGHARSALRLPDLRRNEVRPDRRR